MTLKDNPFYILKLTCTASRRDIIAASEELSLLCDSNECVEAQNDLVNIGKRLTAELNWFIDSDEENLEQIRNCIQNEVEISTDSLSSLDRLNASVYNFSILDENDVFELGYYILDIDEQFSELSVFEILNAVNANHSDAGIAPVQYDDISAELNNIRGGIKQVISEGLASLDQSSYIALVTKLAEKCLDEDDYEAGMVVYDVIDQYEVRMQAVLEKETEKIEEKIEGIKQLDEDEIESNIKGLIKSIKNWDKIAQPLQLKSQASGMPHTLSEKLGADIRNFAMYLNNEIGAAKEALLLVNAMKDVFAEIGELADTFESDSDILGGILKGQKELDNLVEALDSLKSLIEAIKGAPSNANVNNLITRIKNLDKKITTLNLDAKTCNDIRCGMCYLAREAAVEIHNNKHETALALQISLTLYEEFSDIPELRDKLLADKTTLYQELAATKNQATSKKTNSSNSSNSGCLPVFIFIILIMIIGIFGGGSSTSSSKSSSAGSSYSASAEKEYSGMLTSGEKVYIDIKSITPEIGVYNKGSSTYSQFVCKCKTSSSGTVWVCISVSDYRSNFDSLASSSVSNSTAKEVSFSSAKRVHGTVMKADSVYSGLSTDAGTTYLINFSSVK